MSNIMELCMNFKQLGVSEIHYSDFRYSELLEVHT